jgi:uncharacterized membrane protein YdjX (TVP38/TMEM64 family)
MADAEATGRQDDGQPATAVRAGRRWWKPVVLLAIVVVLIVVGRRLELGRRLASVQDWVGSLGPWGPLAFIVIYALATVAAIPGSALTVAAGALFGSFRGVVYVSIASTTGASLCFLIARFFARDAVSHWLRGKEKFERLDRLTETHGAIIVAITRLVPLFPFNLLNYGFGLTRVRFWTYVLFSWLCMIPGTVLFVVGADAVVTAVREGRVPWALVAVIGVVVVILAALVRQARRKISESEQEPQPGKEGTEA